METDVAYFARRALQERLAAKNAPNGPARQSHLEMAERYDELAAAIVAGERDLGLHDVRTNSQVPVSA